MSDKATHYHARPDIRFRVVAGEGVIIRQVAGEAIVVSEVGARILELLREDLSTAQLIERLADEYDVDRGALDQDVPGFLGELEAAGVLQAGGPSTGGE